MADTDGKIQLALDVSPEDAIKSFKRLQAQAQKTFDSLSTDKLSKSEEKALSTLSKIVSKGEEAVRKVQQLSQPVETKEYSKLVKEYETLTQKIGEAKMKQDQFLDTGGKESSRTFQNMTSNISIMEDKLDDVGRELDRIVAEGRQFEVNTEALDSAKNSMMEINNQLAIQNQASMDISAQRSKAADELAEQVRKFLEIRLNAGEVNEVVGKTTERLKEVTKELDALKARQEQLEQAGVGLGYEEFDQNLSKIRELEDEYENLTRVLQDYRTEQENAQAPSTQGVWERTSALIRQIGYDLAHPIDLMQRLATATMEAGNSTEQASNRFGRFSSIINGFKRVLGNVGNSLKSFAQRLIHAGNSSQSFDAKLKKGIMTVLKYGFGIRSLYFLFRKLRSAISDGLSAMAQMNGGVNQTNAMISQLVSSFNLLKGALATAFAPILTVVSPVLSNFMQQLANVITMIGMFIAKLTGAKSFVKATYKATNFAAGSGGGGGGSKGKSAQQKYDEAVKKAQEKYDKAVERVTKSNDKKEAKAAEKNAENMAKAEKKQAKAAEKLAKAQEKANNKLADFDDLNVLGKDDAEDYADELEELKEIQADLAEMPELELPKMEDFLGGGGGGGGAGSPFGLEEVPLDGIEWNWDDLKAKAEELGRGIADKLNEFFKNEDLAKDIGHNIAELLNMALHFAYGFVDELDWRQMGRWFGTLVQEGIETFEWGLLGKTIALFMNGIADSIIGFFERYQVGTLGRSIATMFNNAINTVDPVKIGEAVADILKAPLVELSTFFKATNWNMLGTKIKLFIQNAFTSTALNGQTLGQTIGDFLADAINAGVDLLLAVEPTAIISALIAFFSDIFKKAFAGIDWWDVAQLLFGSHGLVDALITGFAQAILEVTAAIGEALPRPIQEALGFDEFMEELTLIRDGTISAFDELDGTFEGLKWKLDLVGEGVTYNREQLLSFADSGEFTSQQIEKIIQGMQDFATQSGQSLDLAKLGLEGYNGSWDLFLARQQFRNETINKGVQEQGRVIEETASKVGTSFDAAAERSEKFAMRSQTDLQTASTDISDYSTNTNTALQGIQDKSGETALSVEEMTGQINTDLETVTTSIDTWFNELVTNYFSYEIWYGVIEEGMLAALTEAMNTGWITYWDTTIKDWWENHVKPWFSNEKWEHDIYTPWTLYKNTKWEEFIKWWDDAMKDWWDNHVVLWFKEELWRPQFEAVQKVAEDVAEKTKTSITDYVQQIEDFVIASCDTMINKLNDLIDKLKEAISLAEEVNMGGGGGSSSPSSSGSRSSGGGGGSRSSGGRYTSFMPRLDIMHFEDSLNMSAFKFPELATGAVIPPNNRFLAVLGDQKQGMNIETPLATMLEAFRTVMDEYRNPGYNNATMEVDGETFARLMLPYVMDEMRRQGYNTEIIEGV